LGVLHGVLYCRKRGEAEPALESQMGTRGDKQGLQNDYNVKFAVIIPTRSSRLQADWTTGGEFSGAPDNVKKRGGGMLNSGHRHGQKRAELQWCVIRFADDPLTTCWYRKREKRRPWNSKKGQLVWFCDVWAPREHCGTSGYG